MKQGYRFLSTQALHEVVGREVPSTFKGGLNDFLTI